MSKAGRNDHQKLQPKPGFSAQSKPLETLSLRDLYLLVHMTIACDRKCMGRGKKAD